PDLGNTWEGPFLISPLDNWSSVLPSLAVSDSNVYILWMEGMYCSFGAWFNVNLRKSNDNGNNFLPRESLTSLCRGYHSDIYAKDSIVILVWMDDRDNPGQDDWNIYWRVSYDYGNTWTDEERLSFITGNSMWPCLTGFGNEIYLFWVEEEYSLGLEELYFKKGTYLGIKEVKNDDIKFLSSNILFLSNRVIRVYIKRGERFSLDLFNLNGQKIKTLKEGISKGNEEIVLDKISPGNYFLILKTSSEILKRKILILKGGER
ncbi:MAG: T9SS type A sorting domain-containing protein, partial [Thermoplasmata archaeon]